MHRMRRPATGSSTAGNPNPILYEPVDTAGEEKGSIKAQTRETIQPRDRHPTGLKSKEK